MSEIVRVAATSHTTAVAGAIAGIVRSRREAAIQAIGAGAVNQAVKAVIFARGYLEDDGLDLTCSPSFAQVEVGGRERTVVHIKVIAVPRPVPGDNESATA